MPNEIPEITLQELQETGHKYREDFLRLPLIGLESSTKFMTTRFGIRYKETVYSPDFKAELQAYKNAVRQKVRGDFKPRTISTEFGACFFDFDPNQIIRSLWGHAAAQAGQGKQNTPGAREVIAAVIKNISAGLNLHLFDAKQDDNQNTTATLFNGFDTITDEEIKAGNISVANKNLVVLKEKITAQNADQIFKSIMRQATDELRSQACNMFMARSLVDDYNENYLMTHTGINYNTQYNQPVLEGSDGLFTFAPVIGKRGSKYIHITPKENIIIGCDQMSDVERVEINKYEPKLLTGELYMFFGTQFESIDPRRMITVKLVDDQWTDTPASSGSTTTDGSSTTESDTSKS